MQGMGLGRAGVAVLGAMLAALVVAAPSAAAPSTGAPSTGAPSAAAPPETTATQPYVGMPVCKNGRTTGWTCGQVTAINVTVCSPQGCMYGLAAASMYSAPGDQGAPVYYRSELIGTVVGASAGRTYFDPI
jgi:hypothetical protein